MAKKNKLNLLLCNRSYFKISYFIFLSLNMVQYFNISILSRILLILFSLWGLFIVLQEIIINKSKNLFHINIAYPICMIFCCVLAFLWNWDNKGRYNLFALFYYFICVFVLYINDGVNDNRELIRISKAYTVVSFILSGICIVMFLLQTHINITGRSGNTMRIGVWENRLFGFFSSPNVGGTFFFIGIVLSIYLLYIIKYFHISCKWKLICLANLLLSMWYIVLSLSRGTYVSILLTFIISFAIYRIPKIHINTVLQRVFVKSILICFTIIILLIFSALLRKFSQDVVNKTNETKFVIERIEYKNQSRNQSRQVQNTQNDISNKRFGIWKASIKLAMYSPVLGVGNSYIKFQNLSNIEQNRFTSYEKQMINWSGGNIHNGYLQIFVYCGLFAFLFYFLFLLSSLLKVCAFFSQKGCCHINNQGVFVFSIVLYLLINNLFETNMALMGANSFQAAFWLFSGYIISLCNTHWENARL